MISGICDQKCLNGGKCVQKDICECPRGYFGMRCELCKCKLLYYQSCFVHLKHAVSGNLKFERCLSFLFFSAKCFIPCVNGGKCKGNNICRCPLGFKGDHCEIGRRSSQRSTCTTGCRNGTCQDDNTCLCNKGWFGKLCSKRKPWA